MSFLSIPLGRRLTSAQRQPISPPETGWVAPEERSASLTQHYLGTKIIIEDSSSLCVPKCTGKRWDLQQILGRGCVGESQVLKFGFDTVRQDLEISK